MTKNGSPVPSTYWSYRYRRLNGKRRYVRVMKDPHTGKIKIRMAKKRRGD